MTTAETVAIMRQHFLSGGIRPIATRIALLKNLKAEIKRREDEICAALVADFNKHPFDTFTTEIGVVYGEIDCAVKHLRRWSKPKKAHVSLADFPAKGRVYAEGYGVALIIAPWNYPFQLAIAPLVGAIAAGNCAVVKPASRTKATAAVIARIIEAVFSPERVAVAFSRDILDIPFDYIFFTGSAAAGRAVMTAAAKYLTPVTLELGGKSPCIVDRDADLKRAARRIAWGKCVNAGQTCVAPDYLLLHDAVYDAFIAELKAAVQEMYYENGVLRDTFAAVCDETKRAFINELLPHSNVLFGGKTDGNTVEPTAVAADWDSEWMQNEIFAPVLPVLRFCKTQEIIEKINARPRPLALYYFGFNEKPFVDGVPFGGGCVNDTVMHVAEHDLPFGGVGASGMGCYHGKYSFDTFTHYKPVLYKGKAEIKVKYPPYTDANLRFVRKILK